MNENHIKKDAKTEEIKRKKRMKDVRDKIWKDKTKIEYKEI
jgi:hypothetical protein